MPKETEEVASKIVDAAIAVHRALGPGLLESVYEVCLLHELNKRGLKREGSTPQTFGNVLSSHWIPAFAGMTDGSSGFPIQMTPLPAPAKRNECRERWHEGRLLLPPRTCWSVSDGVECVHPASGAWRWTHRHAVGRLIDAQKMASQKHASRLARGERFILTGHEPLRYKMYVYALNA